MNITLTLRRTRTGDSGTFGTLDTGDEVLQTLELPWRQNKSNISCIPAGRYTCALVDSPKYGEVYWVRNVPGRSQILIHSGNFGGDTAKGYKSHIRGCILLGHSTGKLEGQDAVLQSKAAVSLFMRRLNNAPEFTLEVVDETGR